jgi:hypothetical protein
VAFRYRWSCQILYGRYTEFMELQQRKVEVARNRGWSEARFWVATAGDLNDFFIERDFETLDELARELSERENDFEFMKLMRESYKLVVQGSVKTELFQTARTA